MLVRLDDALSPAFKKYLGTPQDLALIVGSLLTPAALGAYALAVWRLCADLDWMGEFFIARGILSRWQIWLAIAILTQLAAHQVGRHGRRKTTAR